MGVTPVTSCCMHLSITPAPLGLPAHTESLSSNTASGLLKHEARTAQCASEVAAQSQRGLSTACLAAATTFVHRLGSTDVSRSALALPLLSKRTDLH